MPANGVLTCEMLNNTPVDVFSPLYRDYLDPNKNNVACEATDIAALADGPNCTEVGRTDILVGDPQYAPKLDGDHDGVACESGNYSNGSNVVTTGYTDGPNCTEIGRTDIPIGDPQYASKLDADNDGIACESGYTRGLPATGR